MGRRSLAGIVRKQRPGEIVLGGAPETLAKRMQHDCDRYGAIVKELNISAE